MPFISGSLAFLVTASHVCFDRGGHSVPLFTIGSGKPRVLLGKRIAWAYRRGETPDIDIAAIELGQEETDDLRQEYQFTTPADSAQTKPKTPGVHYLLAGYPAARNRVTRRNLPSLATHLMTGDIREVTDLHRSDKNDDVHFSLVFPSSTIPSADGGIFRIPKPQGMSGGGVWRLDVDTRRMLASTPLLVGIGIEYLRRSNRFIATRIEGVIPLLWDLVGPSTPWQTP